MSTTTTDISTIEACILRLFRYISTEVYAGKIPTPSKVVFADGEHLRLEQVTIFDPREREITTVTYELVVPSSWQNTEGTAGILTSFMAKLV